jgi:hypothetical protein
MRFSVHAGVGEDVIDALIGQSTKGSVSCGYRAKDMVRRFGIERLLKLSQRGNSVDSIFLTSGQYREAEMTDDRSLRRPVWGWFTLVGRSGSSLIAGNVRHRVQRSRGARSEFFWS